MKAIFTLAAGAVSLALLSGVSAQGTTSLLATALCKPDQFWYPTLSVCLPTGGPPKGTVNRKHCPKDWYYWSSKDACAPNFPNSALPYCPPGHWYSPSYIICKIRCDGPFLGWFASRGQCVKQTAGGLVPTPVADACPSGWHWDYPSRGCITNSSGCPSGYNKDPYTGNCSPVVPPPSASQHAMAMKREAAHKIEQEKRTRDFCPKGWLPCPVKGHENELECINPKTDMNACGGCPTRTLTDASQARNCLKPEGVKRASCVNGRCQVYKCDRRYTISADKTYCESRK